MEAGSRVDGNRAARKRKLPNSNTLEFHVDSAWEVYSSVVMWPSGVAEGWPSTVNSSAVLISFSPSKRCSDVSSCIEESISMSATAWWECMLLLLLSLIHRIHLGVILLYRYYIIFMGAL